MMNTEILEEIGLTKSEIKVYLALLEIGSSSKGNIVKKAGITSSKIYEVLDKLIEKGLVSYVLKNKIKYFNAASPKRILDYLNDKKEKISREEKDFSKLLPLLEIKHSFFGKETDAEIFKGWRGIETVFQDVLNTLKKGEVDLVFGASKGFNEEKTRRFIDKYQKLAYEKGIKVNIIFNEDSRNYYKKSKAPKRLVRSRYLEQTTPSEINIYGSKVAILMFSEEPLAIVINSKEISNSFREYFSVMWKISKK